MIVDVVVRHHIWGGRERVAVGAGRGLSRCRLHDLRRFDECRRFGVAVGGRLVEDGRRPNLRGGADVGACATGRFERLGEVPTSPESVDWIRCECAGEDRVEVRQVGPDLARPGRSIVELPVDHHGRIEVGERRCTGQQMESAGRQRVLVDSAVEFLAHQLFGCGVASGSDEHACAGQRVVRAFWSRYTEAGQRNSSSVRCRLVDQHAAGIDVAVQHAAVVCVVQGVCDRGDDLDHHPRRHAVEMAVAQELGRIRPFDVLRADPQLVFELAAVGEPDDIRMPECRRQVGLLVEPDSVVQVD